MADTTFSRLTGSLSRVIGLVLLIAPIGFAQGPEQSADQSSGQALVQEVINLYESGRLDEAEFQALKALDDPRQLTKLEESELYRLLAFCSIANDDEENSKRHFISALRLNPNLMADPISWSPKVRRVFDQARAEWVQIAKAYAQRQISMEADICRRASLRSLVLPGSGQIMKGHSTSGWVQGVLFWGALGTFIYAEATIPKLRDDYQNAADPGVISDNYDALRGRVRLATLSGATAYGVYAWSLLDALWRTPAPEVLQAEQ